MKKSINLWLLATLVGGLSMSITSCKDDDDNTNEEKQNQELEAKAQASEKFWSVVGQLISYTDITEDYEGKTFEANIGRVADDDLMTRIVSTNTLEAAVQNYNDLTGANITTSTTSHSYNDPDVGTLTWTKTTDGTSWGTVEVHIKQLPHLEKIVYQSYDQGNSNRDFEGKAYYRFGDVIRTRVNGVWEYWICARPAFGKEGKEDSHWVCIGRLFSENIRAVNTTNASLTNKTTWSNSKNEFLLPTELGTNKKHMQNFAEMLYAICFPGTWSDNVSQYCPQGTPFFTDFDYKKMHYHNKYFWQNVQNAWKSKDICNTVLHMQDLAELQRSISQDGVRLLYAGYSWAMGKTCKLYEAYYKNGDKKTEKNMHHVDYLTPKRDMSTTRGNIHFHQGCGSSYYNDYKEFFNDDGKYRWVIRHATGEELSEKFGNGRYDVDQPIDGFEDYYRYYKDVLPTPNLLGDPEDTVDRGYDQAKVNQLIGKDGNLYNSKDEAKEAGTEAVALVVYVGKDADTSTNKEYHGLAIALEYADNGNKVKWCKDAENTLLFGETKDKEQATWPTQLDGISHTNRLVSDNYPAARLAHDYKVEGFTPEIYDMSGWFLPSVGQVMKCLLKYEISVSYKTNPNYAATITSNNLTAMLGRWYQNTGQQNWTFWTSTEYTKDEAVYVNFCFSDDDITFIDKLQKSDTHPVLPFIAF